MKYLKTTKQIPHKIEIKYAIDSLWKSDEIKEHLEKFSILIAQTEELRNCNNLNTIRPTTDYLLAESEPVYFITEKNGKMSMYFLRKFIDDYNSFFCECRIILKLHSPEAISSCLDIWQD